MFIGYGFFYDKTALFPLFNGVKNVQTWRITSGIYEKLNVQSGQLEHNKIPPMDWGTTTLGNCDFENNVNLGNVSYLADTINSIRLKRAITGTDNWQTLVEVVITESEDFKFIHHDFYNRSNVRYTYALVNVDIDGNEQPPNTKEIDSSFNQVVLLDSEDVYYLTSNYTIPSASRPQKIGIYDTIGAKYSTIIKNGLLNYDRMTVSAVILTDTNVKSINTIKQVALRNSYLNFVTNGKPKILKDFNGNIWLIGIISEPSVDYFTELGNGTAAITFEFAEIGNSDNQIDMINNGMTPVKPLFANREIRNNPPYGIPLIHNLPTNMTTLANGVEVWDNTND